MLIPVTFLYSQIAVLNYRCGERLLFLKGSDWVEATKEAVVSSRLQTPVILRAVNTSLFTAGNGAHLDLSCPAARDLAKPGWAQPEPTLNSQSCNSG